MARAYAKRLEAELIVIDKRRPRQNEAEVMNIIGDVKGKNILIVDDLVDTAGTLCNAVEALKDTVRRMSTPHARIPCFPARRLQRIQQSPVTTLVATDSIPLPNGSQKIAY